MPDSAQEAVDSGDLDLRGQKLSIMEDTRPKKRRKRSRQSEICISDGCTKRASFNVPNVPGSSTRLKPIYCAQHKTPNMVNTRCKICIWPDCNRFPSFGDPQTKRREWCYTHKPANAINLTRSTCCLFEGCNKFPSWGDPVLLKNRYCKTHAPEGTVNVDAVNRLKRSKKLSEENPLYRTSEALLEKSRQKVKTLSLERRYLRGEIKKLRSYATKLNASYKKTLNSVTASSTLEENAYKEAWAIIKSVDDLLDGVKRVDFISTATSRNKNQRNSKSGEISSRTNVDEISRKEPSASFSVAESTMEEATPNNDNGDRNLLNDTEDDTTKAKASAPKPSGDIDTAIDIDDEIELMDDTLYI